MSYKEQDPGTGTYYYKKSKRLILQDGSFNVERIGSFGRFRTLYQWLVDTSWSVFFVLTGSVIFLFNLLFALLYLQIGLENISGAMVTHDGYKDLLTAFHFSVQTFSTVGYGALSPVGESASLVSSLEALLGLLISALSTGLLFARFSRPNAKLLFSNFALYTSYKKTDRKSIQFRVANKRSNVLMELEATVILSLEGKRKDGTYFREYFRLPLEVADIHFLPLTWTITHIIDEDSPMKNLSKKDLLEKEAELIILIKAYDDTYRENLYTRHSYHITEFQWEEQFERIFRVNNEGGFTMDVSRIDALKQKESHSE
ncbi:ion channel [Algivirga pacifica]|uniref:Ion channel n=1 Tax=Algivirga pacifica TaxID=1162670 RepID=A0ABP9D763_9BACT